MNSFFIGSNTAPETGPSYLSAADCGIANPTTTAAIGFPNMHIVFNVNGTCGGGTPTPTPTATPTPSPTPIPTATPTPTPCLVFNGSITAGDATETPRLFRDGIPDTCGAAGACATSGTGNFHYDQYTVINTTGSTQCVFVDVNTACTGNNFIYVAAYLGSFNPSSICTNWIADEGGSPNPTQPFSFNLGAGQTAVLVVNEVVNDAGCPAYTLTVSGACGGATPTPTPSPTPSPTPTPTPSPTPTPTPIPCSGNTYVFSASLGNAIVPGTTDIGNHGDDVTTAIVFPFPVNFYGAVWFGANVSSNGNIQFTGNSTTFSVSCPLPNPNLGETILAYQDDLLTSGAGNGIFTSVSGVAPNRIFNIEWRTTYFGRSGMANFEVRLYESSTDIDVIYGQTADNGALESAGVQRSNAGPATEYSCQAENLLPGLKVTYSCGSIGGGGLGVAPIIHVRSTPSRAREGNSANFFVEANRVLTQSVVVNYSMSGNAILDDDYSLTPDCCQITVLAGQMRTPVVLDAFADGVRERRGETATMTLQPGPGYTLVTSTRRPPAKVASIKISD
jgi:hypothetical protein